MHNRNFVNETTIFLNTASCGIQLKHINAMIPSSRARRTATTSTAAAPAAPIRKTRLEQGQTAAAPIAPAAAATTDAPTRKMRSKAEFVAAASSPAPRRKAVKRVAPTRPTVPVPASKKKRTGLQGNLDVPTPLVFVCPAFGINESIVISLDDCSPLDFMLVLVDPVQYMDK
jgi:hypothetical protein